MRIRFTPEEAKVLALAIEHFDGDAEKVYKWFRFPSGSMGGQSPLEAIEVGRVNVALAIITKMIEEEAAALKKPRKYVRRKPRKPAEKKEAPVPQKPVEKAPSEPEKVEEGKKDAPPAEPEVKPATPSDKEVSEQ